MYAKNAIYKEADYVAWIGRLICVFVFLIWPKQVFCNKAHNHNVWMLKFGEINCKIKSEYNGLM